MPTVQVPANTDLRVWVFFNDRVPQRARVRLEGGMAREWISGVNATGPGDAWHVRARARGRFARGSVEFRHRDGEGWHEGIYGGGNVIRAINERGDRVLRFAVLYENNSLKGKIDFVAFRDAGVVFEWRA